MKYVVLCVLLHIFVQVNPEQLPSENLTTIINELEEHTPPSNSRVKTKKRYKIVIKIKPKKTVKTFEHHQQLFPNEFQTANNENSSFETYNYEYANSSHVHINSSYGNNNENAYLNQQDYNWNNNSNNENINDSKIDNSANISSDESSIERDNKYINKNTGSSTQHDVITSENNEDDNSDNEISDHERTIDVGSKKSSNLDVSFETNKNGNAQEKILVKDNLNNEIVNSQESTVNILQNNENQDKQDEIVANATLNYEDTESELDNYSETTTSSVYLSTTTDQEYPPYQQSSEHNIGVTESESGLESTTLGYNTENQNDYKIISESNINNEILVALNNKSNEVTGARCNASEEVEESQIDVDLSALRSKSKTLETGCKKCLIKIVLHDSEKSNNIALKPEPKDNAVLDDDYLNSLGNMFMGYFLGNRNGAYERKGVKNLSNKKELPEDTNYLNQIPLLQALWNPINKYSNNDAAEERIFFENDDSAVKKPHDSIQSIINELLTMKLSTSTQETLKAIYKNFLTNLRTGDTKRKSNSRNLPLQYKGYLYKYDSSSSEHKIINSEEFDTADSVIASNEISENLKSGQKRSDSNLIYDMLVSDFANYEFPSFNTITTFYDYIQENAKKELENIGINKLTDDWMLSLTNYLMSEDKINEHAPDDREKNIHQTTKPDINLNYEIDKPENDEYLSDGNTYSNTKIMTNMSNSRNETETLEKNKTILEEGKIYENTEEITEISIFVNKTDEPGTIRNISEENFYGNILTTKKYMEDVYLSNEMDKPDNGKFEIDSKVTITDEKNSPFSIDTGNEKNNDTFHDHNGKYINVNYGYIPNIDVSTELIQSHSNKDYDTTPYLTNLDNVIHSPASTSIDEHKPIILKLLDNEITSTDSDTDSTFLLNQNYEDASTMLPIYYTNVQESYTYDDNYNYLPSQNPKEIINDSNRNDLDESPYISTEQSSIKELNHNKQYYIDSSKLNALGYINTDNIDSGKSGKFQFSNEDKNIKEEVLNETSNANTLIKNNKKLVVLVLEADNDNILNLVYKKVIPKKQNDNVMDEIITSNEKDIKIPKEPRINDKMLQYIESEYYKNPISYSGDSFRNPNQFHYSEASTEEGNKLLDNDYTNQYVSKKKLLIEPVDDEHTDDKVSVVKFIKKLVFDEYTKEGNSTQKLINDENSGEEVSTEKLIDLKNLQEKDNTDRPIKKQIDEDNLETNVDLEEPFKKQLLANEIFLKEKITTEKSIENFVDIKYTSEEVSTTEPTEKLNDHKNKGIEISTEQSTKKLINDDNTDVKLSTEIPFLKFINDENKSEEANIEKSIQKLEDVKYTGEEVSIMQLTKNLKNDNNKGEKVSIEQSSKNFINGENIDEEISTAIPLIKLINDDYKVEEVNMEKTFEKLMDEENTNDKVSTTKPINKEESIWQFAKHKGDNREISDFITYGNNWKSKEHIVNDYDNELFITSHKHIPNKVTSSKWTLRKSLPHHQDVIRNSKKNNKINIIRKPTESYDELKSSDYSDESYDNYYTDNDRKLGEKHKIVTKYESIKKSPVFGPYKNKKHSILYEDIFDDYVQSGEKRHTNIEDLLLPHHGKLGDNNQNSHSDSKKESTIHHRKNYKLKYNQKPHPKHLEKYSYSETIRKLTDRKNNDNKINKGDDNILNTEQEQNFKSDLDSDFNLNIGDSQAEASKYAVFTDDKTKIKVINKIKDDGALSTGKKSHIIITSSKNKSLKMKDSELIIVSILTEYLTKLLALEESDIEDSLTVLVKNSKNYLLKYLPERAVDYIIIEYVKFVIEAIGFSLPPNTDLFNMDNSDLPQLLLKVAIHLKTKPELQNRHSIETLMTNFVKSAKQYAGLQTYLNNEMWKNLIENCILVVTKETIRMSDTKSENFEANHDKYLINYYLAILLDTQFVKLVQYKISTINMEDDEEFEVAKSLLINLMQFISEKLQKDGIPKSLRVKISVKLAWHILRDVLKKYNFKFDFIRNA